MICYCKREIQDGDRTLTLSVAVDWGHDDLREPAEAKLIAFHSFRCIADWANDRALAHDDVTVKEGTPA